MIIAVLVGCGAPISNVPFREEQTFLRALPLPDRLQAPRDVRLAPGGDDPVLAEAKAFAQSLDDDLRILLDAGTLLTDEQGPDQRTDTRRVWDPFPFAFDGGGTLSGGEPVEGWMQASVERPAGNGDLVWSLDLAQQPDGPWTTVGQGDYDGDNQGSLQWDLDLTAAALGLVSEPLGSVTVDFEDRGTEAPELMERDVTLTFSRSALLPIRILGDAYLQFGGSFQVTEDDASFPGYVLVSHDEDLGGWAVGAVFAGLESEVPFETCWDVQGNTSHQAGGPGIRTQGAAASCPPGFPSE